MLDQEWPQHLAFHIQLADEENLSLWLTSLEESIKIHVDEVEALEPISLVDALIRAKSKLSNLQKKNFTREKMKLLASLDQPTFKNP